LKDCHERKKDKSYRMKQEQEKGELEILALQEKILKDRIETLKSLGLTDVEIRHLLSKLITEPLRNLIAHQNSGLIEYPEKDNEQ
jgi:hypothetical protein